MSLKIGDYALLIEYTKYLAERGALRPDFEPKGTVDEWMKRMGFIK